MMSERGDSATAGQGGGPLPYRRPEGLLAQGWESFAEMRAALAADRDYSELTVKFPCGCLFEDRGPLVIHQTWTACPQHYGQALVRERRMRLRQVVAYLARHYGVVAVRDRKRGEM